METTGRIEGMLGIRVCRVYELLAVVRVLEVGEYSQCEDGPKRNPERKEQSSGSHNKSETT